MANYKDGETCWRQDDDGKWRHYIFSARNNAWNWDLAAGVYDENPNVIFFRRWRKVGCFIIVPIAIIAISIFLLGSLSKIDTLANSMSYKSAALIGYGTTGLIGLAMILGFIFSKSFRLLMLKIFLFIVIIGAIIGAIAYFTF